jgi:hypothetical protein
VSKFSSSAFAFERSFGAAGLEKTLEHKETPYDDQSKAELLLVRMFSVPTPKEQKANTCEYHTAT